MNIQTTGLTFSNMAKRKETTLLVLHHSGTSTRQTVNQIHNYHKNTNGWAGIGYHFYVRTNGDIWQGRPLDYVGAHAYGFNDNSIGICFEGNFEVETMSDAQKESGKWLVTYIKDSYPIEKVVGHRDLMATACPGKNFPFDEIASAKKVVTKDNRFTVKEWQNAAIKDGFVFAKYGADGKWGTECESVAKKIVCKNRGKNYKYKNLTILIQKSLGFEGKALDGLYGADTEEAVRMYQMLHKLDADGIVGINTWKCMLGV
jgi:N-acetyl-anhydromuramyl-L-alanine amidase AmpD